MRSRLVTLALGAVALLACSACFLGNVAFSPDDARIAAVVFGEDDDGEMESQLWLTDLNTLHSRKVVGSRGLAPSVAWAHDGKSLLYATRQEEGGDTHLLQRWDGASARTVLTFELDDEYRIFGIHPVALSADGRFAYLTRGDSNACSIVRQDMMSGESTEFRAMAAGPSLSPDGKHLACFLLTGEEGASLAVLSTASGKPVAVTLANGKLDAVAFHRPAWSRDSRRVAFVDNVTAAAEPEPGTAAEPGRRTELVVLDLASGEFLRGLTPDEERAAFPVWGAGGSHIYYTDLTKDKTPRRTVALDLVTRKSTELAGGRDTFIAGVSHDGKTLALRVLLDRPDKKKDSIGDIDLSHVRLLDLETGAVRDVIVSAFQYRAIAATEFARAVELRGKGDAAAADAAFEKGVGALDSLIEHFPDDVQAGDRLARLAAKAGGQTK